MNPVINKFLVAVAAAIATASVCLADGRLTAVEGATIAISFLSAFGVYSVPNASKNSTGATLVTPPRS